MTKSREQVLRFVGFFEVFYDECINTEIAFKNLDLGNLTFDVRTKNQEGTYSAVSS